MAERKLTQEFDYRNPVHLLTASLLAVRTSFTAFMIAVGLIFLVTALVVQQGVGAAMIGTVGVSLVLFGVVGRVGLKLLKHR